MKNLKIYLILLSVLALAACGGDDGPTDPGTGTPSVNINRNNATGHPERAGLEFPRITDELVLVKRTSTAGFRDDLNYCIGYDLQYKLPRYVCYKMYAGNSASNVSRWYAGQGENQYPQDDDVPYSSRLLNSDDPFWNSGYDHGHMIPSADRLASTEANKQTFFLSNMLPQVNGFNAKVWANMEAQIRTWNRNTFRDTLYVVTGGSYQKDEYVKAYIGSTARGNRIPVPMYFWKAVLCKNASGYKALGFWIKHESSDDSALKKYVVNIDELERLTGLDFFCNLPDEIENQIEAVPAETVARSWGFN